MPEQAGEMDYGTWGIKIYVAFILIMKTYRYLCI